MNLISFTKKQAKHVLHLIGRNDIDGTMGKCHTCKKDLTLDTLGLVAREGLTSMLYCDDPDCFANKIAEEDCFANKIAEEYKKDANVGEGEA